ncbi:TolC family protein [Cytophagaceae bacterium YF14B1]|uniref:TolC family protein n=1 Tax=Xanthocytophaga flava TaxID=3048013 RepID=A0AAE3QLW7_9BACT|nr:TolC family protein [Xanthocytophaga flavus]MDJ1479485.1 TolC family protein [Xanthocytophaga flavus]
MRRNSQTHKVFGWQSRFAVKARILSITRMLIFCLYVLFQGLPFTASAQLASDKKPTTTVESKTMSSQDFLQRILKYHPVARQAALLSEQARNEIRYARGSFDPKLEANYENKELKGSTYYHRWDSQLKIPFWVGEIKGGFQRGVGNYINNENYTSTSGLIFAGVSIPLPISQDFLIDQRRSTLRQAQVFRNIAEADRVKEINKLVFNATKEYWEWYLAHNEYTMLRENYELANIRYKAVKGRVVEGDLAGIDSVEAQTILQDRLIRLAQVEVDLLNARIRLSNYLWGENDTPLEMPSDIAPEQFDVTHRVEMEATLIRLRDMAQANHPELQKLTFKNEQLTIERRFLRDRFKPNLRVNYNLLSSPTYNTDGRILPSTVDMAYLQNNYKWGFEFSYPLFLRKERGKLALNEVKIEQNNLERQQTSREIANNIQTTYNDLRNLDSLIRLQQVNIANYRRLRDAEVQKFENGESSLFLINSRETKYIDEQIKLFSLKTKYAKERAELLWSAGLSDWNQLAE